MGRKQVRLAVVQNGRELGRDEGRAVLIEVSRGFREKQEQRLVRRVKRLAHHPERLSVAKAMFAVEQRIVEALWTLHRLPNDRGVGYANRHGIDYMLDRAEKYALAVAAGGWLTEPPRPSPPSAKAIDAMQEPLDWLRLLDRQSARVLTAGAESKRGDTSAKVKWARVRMRMPELESYSSDRLLRIYNAALRELSAIVKP